ncbi:hypothetical protein O6H91_18G048000 [Diphasiastrum complanatum]|uniref:Uncharacterized protein n=1 Tax=Diphasiastrum complanatum TaxID=34168 RepID=A0ACC2B1M0_DIPCM|nr:hypothetical protein O6H91_18G048000 [Diphasiastrum complanatum]
MERVAALVAFHQRPLPPTSSPHASSSLHPRIVALRSAYSHFCPLFPLLQRPDRMDTMVKVAVPILATTAAAVFLGLFTVGISLTVQPTWLRRWLQKRTPNVLYFKQTEELLVSLTIDDGPHKDITPEILDILKQNDCRATWFIIGNNMDLYPGLVEQIHNEGHEVGNHTMFDVASWRLPLDAFEEQLIEVDRRLSPFYRKDANGNLIKWFRPGHGFYTKELLAIAEAHGYRTALASLFPLDTLFTNQGKQIGEYLLRRMHPGAVILLHDREPQKLQTAEVLRILLPQLRKRGYRVVPLSDLVGLTLS